MGKKSGSMTAELKAMHTFGLGTVYFVLILYVDVYNKTNM